MEEKVEYRHFYCLLEDVEEEEEGSGCEHERHFEVELSAQDLVPGRMQLLTTPLKAVIILLTLFFCSSSGLEQLRDEFVFLRAGELDDELVIVWLSLVLVRVLS